MRPTHIREIEMKKMFLCACAVAIAGTIAVNVAISLNKEIGMNLLLMNVEALADNETNYDGDCSKKGGECTVKLPDNSQLIITSIQKP